MDMTLRWFGEGVDSVSLEQIRQIPGVKGVITTLYDIPAGEVWPMERILQMKEQVEASGLKVLGIESVNIHDAIKVGTPDREQYIANYITTLERLGQAGSSGCMAILISYFSHTGWIALRKYTRLSKRRSSSTSLYMSNSSFIRAIRSGSQPGSSNPLDFSPMDWNIFSGLILSISFWL